MEFTILYIYYVGWINIIICSAVNIFTSQFQVVYNQHCRNKEYVNKFLDGCFEDEFFVKKVKDVTSSPSSSTENTLQKSRGTALTMISTGKEETTTKFIPFTTKSIASTTKLTATSTKSTTSRTASTTKSTTSRTVSTTKSAAKFSTSSTKPITKQILPKVLLKETYLNAENANYLKKNTLTDTHESISKTPEKLIKVGGKSDYSYARKPNGFRLFKD